MKTITHAPDRVAALWHNYTVLVPKKDYDDIYAGSAARFDPSTDPDGDEERAHFMKQHFAMAAVVLNFRVRESCRRLLEKESDPHVIATHAMEIIQTSGMDFNAEIMHLLQHDPEQGITELQEICKPDDWAAYPNDTAHALETMLTCDELPFAIKITNVAFQECINLLANGTIAYPEDFGIASDIVSEMVPVCEAMMTIFEDARIKYYIAQQIMMMEADPTAVPELLVENTLFNYILQEIANPQTAGKITDVSHLTMKPLVDFNSASQEDMEKAVAIMEGDVKVPQFDIAYCKQLTRGYILKKRETFLSLLQEHLFKGGWTIIIK